MCERVEGWCTPDKACHIAEVIIENDFEQFVEIGVFAGKSLIAASYALKHLGRGVAWGIDLWSNDAALEHMTDGEYVESWSRKNLEKVYVDFVEAVIEHELTKQCRWIRERSEVAVRMFEDASLDMIHIDGNHSEEMSSLDVRLWLPKVRPSGIVLMDDTDEIEWPSTRKAVGMLKEGCDLIAERDGYSLFRKRGAALN